MFKKEKPHPADEFAIRHRPARFLKGKEGKDVFGTYNKWKNSLYRERESLPRDDYTRRTIYELEAEMLYILVKTCKEQYEELGFYRELLKKIHSILRTSAKMISHIKSRSLNAIWEKMQKEYESMRTKSIKKAGRYLERLETEVRECNHKPELVRKVYNDTERKIMDIKEILFERIPREISIESLSVERFVEQYIEIHKEYLKEIYYHYVEYEVKHMKKNYNKEPRTEIIQRHKNFMEAMTKKLNKVVDDIAEITGDRIRFDSQMSKELIQRKMRELMERDINESILSRYGVNLMIEGYEEDDQQKIYAGAQLHFHTLRYPNLIDMKISSRMTFIHGVSTLYFDENGSWEKTKEGIVVKNLLPPKEYVERILSILRTGIRPSKREDSPFSLRSNALARLQEVFFFDYNEVKDSRYGLIDLLYRPGKNYVIFRGYRDIAGYEYFILTKSPVLGDFEVILTSSKYIRRTGSWYLKNGTEIQPRDYINEVRRYLEEYNITYREA